MAWLIEMGNLLANIPSYELLRHGHQSTVQGRSQPNIFWTTSGANAVGVFKTTMLTLCCMIQGYPAPVSGDSTASGLLHILRGRTGVVQVDDPVPGSACEQGSIIRSVTGCAKREVRAQATNGGVRGANNAVIEVCTNHVPQLAAAETSRIVQITVGSQTQQTPPEAFAAFSALVAPNGAAGSLAGAIWTLLAYVAHGGGSEMIGLSREMLLDLLYVGPSRQIDNHAAVCGRLIEFCALAQVSIDDTIRALAELVRSLHSKLFLTRAKLCTLALFAQGVDTALGQNKIGAGIRLTHCVDMHNFICYKHAIHGNLVVVAYESICQYVLPSVKVRISVDEFERAMEDADMAISKFRFMKANCMQQDVLMSRSEDPQEAPTPRTYEELRQNEAYWATESKAVVFTKAQWSQYTKEGVDVQQRDWFSEVKNHRLGCMLTLNDGSVVNSLPEPARTLALFPMLAESKEHEAAFASGFGPGDVTPDALRAKLANAARNGPWDPPYIFYGPHGATVPVDEIAELWPYMHSLHVARSDDDEHNADLNGSVHMTGDDPVPGSNSGSDVEGSDDGWSARSPLSSISPNARPAKRGRKGPVIASDPEDSPSDDDGPARVGASMVIDHRCRNNVIILDS